MTKRMATYDEATSFLVGMIKNDLKKPSGTQLQKILEDIFPYSWARYCAEHKIKEEIRC